MCFSQFFMIQMKENSWWNQGFLSNLEGKTSSTSGIDTEGEARGTIPEGNEV